MSESEFPRIAVLGAGLIGRSWTALFAAAGLDIAVYDPDPRSPDLVRRTIEEAWPALRQLGLAPADPSGFRLDFIDDPEQAVTGADFIQESVPEVVSLKHELYAAIEPAIAADAIIASSASGLMLGELQAGWRDPSRLVLGHPFNPPHLIPLVEVMGNDRTAPGVVDRARAFYESVGKVTIEVRREVPGHVANRLQAALWREAVNLAKEGVASVADIDTAIASGPGLRWAVMGPTMLFHLGGDDEGLSSFCERYSASFNRWWDDLGTPHLDDSTVALLVAGAGAGTGDASVAELAALRDERLTEVIAATHPPIRGGAEE